MRNKRRNGSFLFGCIFAASVAVTVIPLNVKAEEALPVQSGQTSIEAEGIRINETAFPDDSFRTYILENFDVDENGSLSVQEIETAKVIDFGWDDSVTNLQGLDYFTYLEKLNCAGTGISTLDISKLVNLKELNCSYASEITQLDVTQNEKLEILWCYETQIDSLDVSKNMELIRLDCNHTQITELNVEHNPKLFALNCEDTVVSTLNISSNPELYEVYITNTPIKEMDYSQNPELVHIRVSGTPMTEIDVTHNPKLAALTCYDTQIKELNLSNNPQMFELFCYNTPIETLDLSKFAGLRTVEAYNTNLMELDVSHNPNLAGLDISNTGISSLDVSNNKELQRLNVNNTNIMNLDISQNKLMRKLNCSDTDIAELNISGFTNLEDLYCQNTNIATLDLRAAENLVSLNCSGNQLTQLDLSNVISLWNEGVVSPQCRVVYCTQSSAGRVFDLKSIVDDISKVNVEDGQGYTYDASNGILTVTDEKTDAVTYTYDHGYNQEEIAPMQVQLKLNWIYGMLSERIQTFTGKDLEFISECSIDKFEKVLVDGKELSSDKYSVKSGSTSVTLKKEYLATLSAGEHVIQIISADGLAEGIIIIENKGTSEGNQDKIPSEKVTQTDEVSGEKAKGSPQTGDDTKAGILFGSGAAALLIILKRRNRIN